MKKDIPKTKAAFAAMLIREYGYSEKLAKDCAAIVSGHGAFPEEKKGKSWNGKKRCAKIIARMPYHKENKPQCKLPCLPNSDYCRLHQDEAPQAYLKAREEMLDGWDTSMADTSIRQDDGRNVTISVAKIKTIYLEGCSAGRWPNPDDEEAYEKLWETSDAKKLT